MGALTPPTILSLMRSLALPINTALVVPFLTLKRLNYTESAPLPPFPADSTLVQKGGNSLHNQILSAKWEQYAAPLDITSIVVMSHYLDAPMAIFVSALKAGSKPYPLASLATSGIGSE